MKKRRIDLLVNALLCFEEHRSPFSHTELLKHNVTADECKDLSNDIGLAIRDFLESFVDDEVVRTLLKRFSEEHENAR